MHATMTHYVADVPGFMAGPTNHNSPRHPSWMTATTTTSSSSSSGRSDTKNEDDDALLFSMSETAETGDLFLLNKIECEGGGTSRKATPLLLPTASSRSMMNRRREIISQLIHQHPSSFRSMIPDMSSESNSNCQSDIHPAQARVESGHRTCAPASIGANFTVNASTSREEEEVVTEAQETNREILLQDSIDDTATIICSKHDEDELEEVSLDPKWAEALRAISIRLASEKAEYQSFETAEWDTLVHSDSPVDVTESLSEKRDKGCLMNRSTPSIPILTDLQRTIEEATKSIGKFSLNAGSNDDDGDNMSLSSFASDAHLVTKNFAEYKKRTPPQHRSLRDDPAPWSHGLEFYPKQMYFGAANNVVARHHHHHEELNNDVLSVTSSLTCESYNSLVAPSTSSRVTTSLSKVLPHTERSCYMVNPVEMEVTAPILEAPQTSDSNPELGPSSMVECMNDTGKNAKKSVTRRSSTKKKKNTHLESAQVLKVADENNIGRGNARSISPAEDDMFEAPRKSLLSFLAALGQHSRSRSCSRSRQKSDHDRSKSRTRTESHSRSKPRGVSKSRQRSKSRTRNHEKEEYEPAFEPWTTKSDQDEQQKHNEQKSCTLPESELPNEVEQRTEEPISQTLGHQDVAPNTQEPQTPLPIIATLEQPGERCPIAHPHYKLGDSACDEDMLVFPTSIQQRRRRGRARRREPNIDSAETLQSTSSCSESNDREGGGSRANECSVDIQQAIGQLRHLDAAFIRRSDGSWTYALVADGNEDEIRFVVNDQGCTKVVPKSLWMSHVRRIRVLTQRQGDRIAVRGQPNREMQMYGKTQSCRGREKGRLVSPSPTRWKSCDLKLPTTIAE